MYADEYFQVEEPMLECPTSTSSTIDTATADASVTVKKIPSRWGNIRDVATAYEFFERTAEFEEGLKSDAGPSSMADSDRTATERRPTRSISFKTLKEGLDEEETTKENPAASKTEFSANNDIEYGDDCVKLEAGQARRIAIRALAAMSEEDEPPSSLSTPLQQAPQRPPLYEPAPSSSPSLFSPPQNHSQSRPPLRSPCWRNLVPVTPPPGGYWTPSSTEKGEKNTPMCPPCRSGKKGRCFGGLPCERCRNKGYSKERCEGRVVFRFSPKKKIVKGQTVGMDGLRHQTDMICEKEPPASGGRWKKDSFWRFLDIAD